MKDDRLEQVRTTIEKNTVRREGRYEFEGLYSDVRVVFLTARFG